MDLQLAFIGIVEVLNHFPEVFDVFSYVTGPESVTYTNIVMSIELIVWLI